MSRFENMGFAAAVVGGVLLAVGIIWAIGSTISKIDKGFDNWSRENDAQWQRDKANCESKGGIATQSSWNGQITNCIYPPTEPNPQSALEKKDE